MFDGSLQLLQNIDEAFVSVEYSNNGVTLVVDKFPGA